MRREPRSMTAADAMTLTAGVGLGIALADPPEPGPTVHPVLMSLSWVTVGAVAVSIVVLARLIRYRRRAKAAEWLAILVSIYEVTDRPEWQVDRAINLIYGSYLSAEVLFTWPQWATAGLTATIIAAGRGLAPLRNAEYCRPGSRRQPPPGWPSWGFGG